MEIINIPIEKLFLADSNTRKDLGSGQEDGDLENLADSIRKHGLMSPLTVRASTGGRFEIVSGQRRFLASKKLALAEVPCIVRDSLDDDSAVVLSLVENVHRADMKPIDKARALKKLLDIHSSVSKVASETAWSESTIRKYLKLLELPEELQEKLSTTEGPAKVSAMAKLAQTFTGEEAIEVYDRISGFKQSIQEEILSRSGGDIDKIGVLVSEAHDGAFDTRMCGGKYGCEVVRDIVEGEMTQDEFVNLVKEVSDKVKSKTGKEQLRNASRMFWKTLAKK